MPETYEPIATTTLTSVATNVEFTSIPGTYTDLQLVLIGKNATNASNPNLSINSDSGTNYSVTRLFGTGAVVTSNRNSSISSVALNDGFNLGTTTPQLYIVDFLSYANSTNKTFLITSSQDENGSGESGRYVAYWRNTSAITTIKVTVSAGNFAIGTMATLYGIKAA